MVVSDDTTRGAQLAQQALDVGLDTAAQDAGVSDLTQLRAYLNSDLFAFAQLVFGFKDLIPTLHGDLAAWIKSWGWCKLRDGSWKYYTDVGPDADLLIDNRRIMTQIPREFFKSSVGTLANSLWQICREPHLPVGIFNEKQKRSEKWLKAIRDVAAGNKFFQQIYRDLLPPGVHFKDSRTMPRSWKWSDSELDFGGKQLGEVEPSISAHGIEGAAVGGHWPKLILDDLISMNHKQSIVEMERAREWIKNHTFLMRPAERSMVYVNCTPWTYSDIYRDCLVDYGYRLYRRSGLEFEGKPDVARGESIFPQKLSTAKLRDMHRRNPFDFSSQVQCIPMAGTEQSFSSSMVRYGSLVTNADSQEPNFLIDDLNYDVTIGAVSKEPPPPQLVPLHQMSKVLILDPAPTEESQQRQDPHARNGVLAVGMDCWGRRYLLDAWADRQPYSEVIAKLFEMSIKWSIDRVMCEEVNFSNVYRHWIRRETERDGRWAGHQLVCLPLYPKGREKHARIRATEPDWRQGFYYVNRATTGQFLVELTEYPNSQTVDLLDCMGYIKESLTRPLTSTELTLQRRQSKLTPYSTPYYEVGPEPYN